MRTTEQIEAGLDELLKDYELRMALARAAKDVADKHWASASKILEKRGELIAELRALSESKKH